MTRQQEAEDLNRVRIPAELNANLDRYFSTLKRHVLYNAVKQAAARTSPDAVCVLQTDELIASAKAALAEAALELNEEFSTGESRHVRWAS